MLISIVYSGTVIYRTTKKVPAQGFALDFVKMTQKCQFVCVFKQLYLCLKLLFLQLPKPKTQNTSFDSCTILHKFEHNFSQLGLIDDHQPPPHLTGGRGWPLPLYSLHTPIYPYIPHGPADPFSEVGYGGLHWGSHPLSLGQWILYLAKFGGVAYFLGQLLLGQNFEWG